ncbi:MAG: ribonuclease J [Mycoplasmataceae bacterium]|jgi:ribonuclease J|nr:ribonuclease J [Mycoplasmataceae bacterium]
MANVEFLALSGLDDKEKSCLVLNINDNIFILNCGIDIPSVSTLGIQGFVPDFAYLAENKSKIKGLFIGTAYYEKFGGLQYMKDELIPKIYTSEFNKKIIEGEINKKLDFEVLTSLTPIVFNNIKVTPFKIANFLPSSLGFIFSVDDENYIYIEDGVVTATNSKFTKNDLLALFPITNGKKNILLTTPGIVNVESGFAAPHFDPQHFINGIIEDAQRTIIALYSFELYKISAIFESAIKFNRQVTFVNKKTLALARELQSQGYLQKNVKIVDFESVKGNNSVIIIVDENKHKLYVLMESIIAGECQPFIFNAQDTFLFASSTINGYEKKEADLFDNVNRTHVKHAIKLDKQIIDFKPGGEDLKFLVSLFQPAYVIPVDALYMKFVLMARAISELIPTQKILILDNGRKIKFNNGVYDTHFENIPINAQPISLEGAIDLAGGSLIERKQMQADGAVVVSFLIDQTNKKVLQSKYEMIGVGELNEENAGVLKGIKDEVNDEFNRTLAQLDGNSIREQIRDVKMNIRRKLDKQFLAKFEKRPLIVITTVLRSFR